MSGLQARALAALLLSALPLGGCYVLKSAAGQLELESQRVPIASLIQDPDTPARLKLRLEAVEEIRRFASEALELPDNRSYRSYADLKRRYVVWNVFATPEFSVEPRTWCFPFVGCVSYRGYFNEAAAQRYAYGLKRQDCDVVVEGVAAYSTLGHFADPVLSTMLGWDDTELAAIIFHELAHQRLYVPGDSAFNEAFATTVEQTGVRRWLEAKGRGRELAAFLGRAEHEERLAGLVTETRGRLKALYARPLAAPAMRLAKAMALDQLRDSVAALGEPAEDAWLLSPALNNATLLSVATYYACVPGFEAELAAVDGDLKRFYARARALAKEPAAERHRVLCLRASRPAAGAA